MNGLEKITERIAADAQAQADDITAQAKAQAAEIVADYQARATPLWRRSGPTAI